MKRGLILSLILVLMIMVVGCGKKQKTMICSISGTNAEGREYSNEYVIKYTGDYVDELKITEKIKSDNQTYLNTLKKAVETEAKPFKDIKYYDYDVEIKGNEIIAHRTVNYKKIDTDALIKASSANKALIKDGKVKLDDIKKLYESYNFKCE